MAEKKEKKNAAQAAAEQKAPETGSTKIISPKKLKGLSQEAKVTYLNSVQKEREFLMKDGANAPEAIINGYSLIAQATILDIAVGEIACGESVTGYIISRNDVNYSLLQEMGKALGVSLKPLNELPAPTMKQLEAAGMAETKPEEAAVLVVNPKDVTAEAKKKKKAEKEIENKAPLDPTKIENNEQLKEQLMRCFLTNESPIARIEKAINFYHSYLSLKANKSGDEKEIESVKNMSRITMLRQITEIIGDCTFAITGIAHFLNESTNQTGSPVSAFCTLKRAVAKNSDTNADDEFVADVAKILIIWSCTTKISEYNKLIKINNKNLENFGKDKKKYAREIKIEQAAKSSNESEITGYQGIIDCVNNPSFDIISNLEANYDGDKDARSTKIAHRIVSNIMDTFYDIKDTKDYTKESVLNVAKYHAGVITNMFCDPLEKNVNYVDATAPELVKAEKPAEETSSEEKEEKTEESKN